MAIKQLDDFLTVQIAAGEVIERPASVVKELLENSLDAKALHIEIEVMNSGSDLISVRDDGNGISKEDLPLAIMRYATSKISSLEDLERILTLGFRGEALASISSVSRFTLASRQQGQNIGWQIHVAGKNSAVEVLPAAHQIGTSAEARDLFFNTPARRKFLRSARAEFRKIEETVARIALSRFDVGFVLRHNGRVVQQLEAAKNKQDRVDRVAMLCGREFAEQSLVIYQERNGLKLEGWIGKPSFSRSAADLQYFYINGRMVRDKLMTHAIRQAYRDVLAHGRQPAFVLYLELDPEVIDANVHPTKMEVRFRDSRNIYSFLVFSIKQALSGNTKDIFAENEFSGLAEIESGSVDFTHGGGKPHGSSVLDLPSSRVLDSGSDRIVDLYIQQSQKKQFTREAEQQFIDKPFTKQMELPLMIAEERNNYQTANAGEEVNENSPDGSICLAAKDLGHAIAQLAGTYILAQNSSGLIIVDIHAAHERITYEKLKRDYSASALEAQALLMPLTLNINKTEADCAEEYQNELKKCGLEIECLGSENLIVRKMPALIKASDAKQFIQDLLSDLSEYGTSSGTENYIHRILASFACHHSVRANQKLSLEEMNALLRQIEQTERADQCSHGRPTWIQLPFNKIAKMFLRS